MSSNASSLVIIFKNMQSLVQEECSPNLAVALRIVLMRLAAEPSSPVGLVFGHVEALVIDLCGGTGNTHMPSGQRQSLQQEKLGKEKKRRGNVYHPSPSILWRRYGELGDGFVYSWILHHFKR